MWWNTSTVIEGNSVSFFNKSASPVELLNALNQKRKEVSSWSVQEYLRDWKMAGLIHKSDNSYNREEDEYFRMCRP